MCTEAVNFDSYGYATLRTCHLPLIFPPGRHLQDTRHDRPGFVYLLVLVVVVVLVVKEK